MNRNQNISFCKTPHIYKITDLRNGKIYIGKTKGGSSYFSGGKLVNSILKVHGFSVFKRDIIVQGDFNETLLNELEKHYIRLFNSNDSIIGYNFTNGGEGISGHKHSEETLNLFSKQRKGKKNPKLSQTFKECGHPMLGKKLSEEQIEAIKKANTERPSWNKGIKLSEEHIEKMSKSLKGRKGSLKGKVFSEEHRKNISKSRKNIIISEETKRKISESNKGKERSEEFKKNHSDKFSGIGNPFYGKVHSEETKRKISEAMKIRRIKNDSES
jgi:hypothetical protein